jgi:Zn-dependent protease with chaperone function/outer membrane protein assembly factor BamD (BamD/ComL family)
MRFSAYPWENHVRRVEAKGSVMMRRFVALLLVTALGAGTSPLAAQTPNPGDVANANLFENSLEAARQAYRAYGSPEPREGLDRVVRIGYELAQKTRFTEFPFSFYLVDMPVPNAFALPGGQIFVTRGMMDLGLDDDMLACLLGHEISHVTEHHGTRMQKRATLVGLLSQALIIGAIAGAKNNRTSPTDPYSAYGIQTDNSRGDIIQGTAAVSLVLGQLLLLSYSREYETEADDEGQRLAAAAGYDPAGAQSLWRTMLERIPLTKAYGYWRTHPFEDSRMRSAEERSKYLKIMPKVDADAYRATTQDRLLTFAARPKVKPELTRWVEETSLWIWPKGPAADGLRMKELHLERDEIMKNAELSRDYGRLIEDYEDHLATVVELTPESPFLATAGKELEDLRAEVRDLYPKAEKVLQGGIYETAFLEGFRSNYPDSPEAHKAALALGLAYSRLRQPAEAVEQFIAVLRRAPGSEEAAQARTGLRNLTEFLDNLVALEKLNRMDGDPELQSLAGKRLDTVATRYDDLVNGADYLKKYPKGGHADPVTERLNTLAQKLYTEVLVYQGVGDHAKALERMNRILAYAPLSPAADQLRERTTLDT